MNNKGKKIKIFSWLLLAVFFIWLLWLGIAPTGKIAYESDFPAGSFFLSKFSPNDRLGEAGKDGVEIKGDPAYFTLRTLRPFEKAKLIIEYENEDHALVEAGVLVDNRVWRYDLRPVGNLIIDDLENKWQALREGDILLLQKNKKFSSIKEFLDSDTEAEKIGVYNYQWDKEYLMPGYASTTAPRRFGYALRGDYQFHTYIKNEDLNFKFSFEDLNKNKNADPIDINLYYQGTLIDSRHLDDPGEAKDDGVKLDRGQMTLSVPGLPEGAYKIEVKANDDIVTKEIESSQAKISFINKIRLADGGVKNLTLFTDSNEVSAQTTNPGNLQTVKIGEKKLVLEETYKQYSTTTEAQISLVSLSKDDVIIAGDGVFALDKSQLFNPNPKKVNRFFRGEDADYIIADYISPEKKGNLRTAEVEFDLSSAYFELEPSIIPGLNKMTRKYSFLVSIPGLRVEDGDEGIVVRNVRVELEGKSLKEFLWR